MNGAALLADEHDLKKEFSRGKVSLIAFLIVFGLHAGALAIVELYSPKITQAPLPPMAMSVELSPIPAAPVAPASAEAAPQSLPPEATPEVRSEPEPPPLEVEAPSLKLPPPPRKVERPPERQREIAKPLPEPPAAASVAAMVAPNVAPAPVSPGQADSAMMLEARKNWIGLVMAYLEQHKRYPRQAQSLRQEGTVFLRFAIDRKGDILGARLEKTSDYSILDNEGLAMLERAGRLPPPPLEIKGDVIELVVPVRFFLRR